jgi:glycosyltransferase involved in cell wall biosynthesis
MPVVSIVMNVRNGAATLREAIQSVLAQTFPEWELIVWDDRSSDASAGIVAQFRDPRIRYFLAPDEVPLGKARRDAIGQAQAEWVAFLDQDDVWLPGKLDKQMALADAGVGLIYGRTIRFYLNGTERDYDHAHEYQWLPEGDIFTQLFTKSCFIAMSSAVFRRSAIDAIGGIPDNIQIIPDYYLYVAVARRYPVRAVQTAVCRYRMHSGSMSQVAARQMHEEVLWLVDHWTSSLDPDLVKRCRKRHYTAIALEEMRCLKTLRQGMARLFTQGSPASQLSRPFTFAFHLVRRKLQQPYWRAPEKRSGV